MTMLKRLLLIVTPLMFLLIVGSLYATPKKPAKCGTPPTGITAFLQNVGLAGKSKACETASPNIPGEWCANPGHHCSGPDGPGKCTSVFDVEVGEWSCVCVKPTK